MMFSVMALVLAPVVGCLAQEDPARDRLIVDVISKKADFDFATASEKVKGAVGRYLSANLGGEEYFQLVERFKIKEQKENLLKLAKEKPQETAGVTAVKLLLGFGEGAALEAAAGGSPALLGAVGSTGAKEAVEMLSRVVLGGGEAALKTTAVEALGKSRSGEVALLELVKAGRISDGLKPAAAKVLGASADEGTRTEAGKHLTMAAAPVGPKLPPISELAKRTGNPETGHAAYKKVCFICHQVGAEGVNFGPALSEIGSKYPKDGLYTSILEPSAGISFGFEGWEITLKDGAKQIGIITSETDAELTLRAVGGIDSKITKGTIATRQKMEKSLMPEGLHAAFSEQELVDLVEYLAVQRKK